MMYTVAHKLESKQDQEGHHQAEEAHSLRQGETHNTVGEQLTFHAWITSVCDHEATKDGSDTSA